MEGVSSRIIFESSGALKQEQRPFFVCWYLYCGNYYLNGSPALRSFIYVDVGEPTSHPCSMTGMMQDHHLPLLRDFESLGTSMYGICYDIVKEYWAAWGLLFWKRSVSPSFLGVFLCCFGFVFGWVCVWLGLLGLVLEDTWPFAFTYSPTCGNSLPKTIRFDDRQSLERARHELKKISQLQQHEKDNSTFVKSNKKHLQSLVCKLLEWS